MATAVTSTSTSISKFETCAIEAESSLLSVRRALRTASKEAGLSLVEETKLVTAASELARNILEYAGHGSMTVERLNREGRIGIQARFEDQGPGIVDVDLAMQDNYSSNKGLGMGLPGSKRLCDEFDLTSAVGKGTTVTVVQWKQ